MRCMEVSVGENDMKELLRYTKALLVLQIAALSTSDEQARPEILLARAGLPVGEIAKLLGKNPAAVAKAIQRAGKQAG
jgi:DNA-directed RNA polymerase specialized sigma24 family protein